MKQSPPLHDLRRTSRCAALTRFLASPPVDPSADRLADRVLSDIRRNGDAAVSDATYKFNGIRLKPAEFRVPYAEIADAGVSVDAAFRRAVADTLRRVRRFARAGLRSGWTMRAPRGGRLGERFVPLDRVGVYVPGGVSPLASTALMTVPLAAVAGVREIVAVTPCGPIGKVDPHILYALVKAGVTEIYRLGGIQAIGALAYGTKTVRSVDKIVGPGGPYVTAAKRRVYGSVALDMVAGPSEIAVLADESADPTGVAADLLSQAEHGTGHERTLLVTTGDKLASEVQRELIRLTASLPRADRIGEVLSKRSAIVIVGSLEQGVEIVNRFAPEHLEILTREPRAALRGIRCAGAVFLGPWTPESAGDFVAGPSHVLPTGGSARYFAGLTVEDFRRRMSVIELSRGDLQEMLPTIECFARVESLPAHALSARLRLDRA